LVSVGLQFKFRTPRKGNIDLQNFIFPSFYWRVRIIAKSAY